MSVNKKYFFTHDVDAHEDVKIKKLIKKFGYEGYGIFWHLIEVLRNTDGYKIENNLEDLEVILYQTNIILEDFINFCIKVKLLILEDNYIFSESLNKRMDIMAEIKENKSRAGKLGNMIRWGKKEEENNIAEISQCDNSAIADQSQDIAIKQNKIKQKEIKENKTKQNKIKQNNMSSQSEEGVVVCCSEEQSSFGSVVSATDSLSANNNYAKAFNVLNELFPGMIQDDEWAEVNELVKKYDEKFIKACQVSKTQGGKSFNYIKGILKNWENSTPRNKFVNYPEEKVNYDNFDEENLNKLLEKYGGTN